MNIAGKTLLGALALGLVATMTPQAAEAGHRGHRVTDALLEIDYAIQDLRDIRNPHRKFAQIDRLQARLSRLEHRTSRRHGRRARRNAVWIDDLQARLARIERRTHRRAARHRYRAYYYDHRRGGFRFRHR